MLFLNLNVKRFSRQLALLLEEDVMLTKALELIALQQRSRRCNNMILDIRQYLRNGETFSEALSHYKKVFPLRYRETIKWADSTGSAASLVVALRLLTDDTAPRPPRQSQNNFERSNPLEAPFL